VRLLSLSPAVLLFLAASLWSHDTRSIDLFAIGLIGLGGWMWVSRKRKAEGNRKPCNPETEPLRNGLTRRSRTHQ
jgi:LPXTG-motif cell wall-anchored protein